MASLSISLANMRFQKINCETFRFLVSEIDREHMRHVARTEYFDFKCLWNESASLQCRKFDLTVKLKYICDIIGNKDFYSYLCINIFGWHNSILFETSVFDKPFRNVITMFFVQSSILHTCTLVSILRERFTMREISVMYLCFVSFPTMTYFVSRSRHIIISNQYCLLVYYVSKFFAPFSLTLLLRFNQKFSVSKYFTNAISQGTMSVTVTLIMLPRKFMTSNQT